MASCDVLYCGDSFHHAEPSSGGNPLHAAPPRDTPPPAYRPPSQRTDLPPYRSPKGSLRSIQSDRSSYTSEERHVPDSTSSGFPDNSGTDRRSRDQVTFKRDDTIQELYVQPSDIRRGASRRTSASPPPASTGRRLPSLSVYQPSEGSQYIHRPAPLKHRHKVGPPKPPRCSQSDNNKDTGRSIACGVMDRRRTWSPPTFSRALQTSGGAFLAQARAFRSNDQLDMLYPNTHGRLPRQQENYHSEQEESIYEDPDLMTSPPPNIAPISGQVNQNRQEELIRPIAFKPTPVGPLPSRYVPTPARPNHCTRLTSPLSTSSPPLSPQSGPLSPDTTHLLEYPYHHHQQYTTGYHGRSMRLTGQQVSLDDGYVSQPDYHSNGGHNYSTSGSDMTSYLDSSPPSNHTSPEQTLTAVGHRTSPRGRYSNAGSHEQEFSPVDLEALIRDKDAEIAKLRAVMEKNETAIFQVFEEKRQNWEVELHDVAMEWEKRLKQQQQKAFRTEQSLMMKVFQSQQDERDLRQEVEDLKEENKDLQDRLRHHSEQSECHLSAANDHIQDMRHQSEQQSEELSTVHRQLSDSNQEVRHLKQYVQEAEMTIEAKKREIQRLKEQLNLSMSEAGGFRAEVDRLQRQAVHHKRNLIDKSQQTDGLSAHQTDAGTETDVSSAYAAAEVLELHRQVDDIQTELMRYKQAYQVEKSRWLEEKDKVIRYQKHLQLNYTQMRSKNKSLEADIQQLMLELEARENMTAVNGASAALPFSSSTASQPPKRPSTISNLNLPPPSPLASSTLKRDGFIPSPKSPPAISSFIQSPLKAMHRVAPSSVRSLSPMSTVSAKSSDSVHSKLSSISRTNLPLTTC